MRDNGFLEPTTTLGAVAEIIAQRRFDPITATPSDTVIEVIERMKEYNISQLPLVENGVPTGLISEVDLLGRVESLDQLARYVHTEATP